jgi:hypothetical protein
MALPSKHQLPVYSGQADDRSYKITDNMEWLAFMSVMHSEA